MVGFLFERGREYERGLHPLSPLLPSPALISGRLRGVVTPLSLSPSPANKNTALYNKTGWRGAGVR
jgi:hypothetical protein